MEAEKSATSLDGLFELLDESRFRTMDLFAMLDTDRSGTVEMQELHNTLTAQMHIDPNYVCSNSKLEPDFSNF